MPLLRRYQQRRNRFTDDDFDGALRHNQQLLKGAIFAFTGKHESRDHDRDNVQHKGGFAGRCIGGAVKIFVIAHGDTRLRFIHILENRGFIRRRQTCLRHHILG